MATIEIEVDPDVAAAYVSASEATQKKFRYY